MSMFASADLRPLRRPWFIGIPRDQVVTEIARFAAIRLYNAEKIDLIDGWKMPHAGYARACNEDRLQVIGSDMIVRLYQTQMLGFLDVDPATGDLGWSYEGHDPSFAWRDELDRDVMLMDAFKDMKDKDAFYHLAGDLNQYAFNRSFRSGARLFGKVNDIFGQLQEISYDQWRLLEIGSINGQLIARGSTGETVYGLAYAIESHQTEHGTSANEGRAIKALIRVINSLQDDEQQCLKKSHLKPIADAYGVSEKGFEERVWVEVCRHFPDLRRKGRREQLNETTLATLERTLAIEIEAVGK